MRSLIAVGLSPLFASLLVACFPAPLADAPDAAPGAADGEGGGDSATPPEVSPGEDTAPSTDAVTAEDSGGAADTGIPGGEDGQAVEDTAGGGADTVGPRDDIPLAELAATYSAAYCDYLARCDTNPGGEALLRLFARADLAGCRRWLEARFIREALPQLDSGAVVYDGRAAARCLNGLAVDCGASLEGSPDCDAVFIGQRGDGQPCRENQVCSPGLHCQPSEQWYCDGACMVSPKIGEACQQSGRCSQLDGPADCNWETGLCEARSAPVVARPGEACGLGAQPREPRLLVICPADHACWKSPSNTVATCQPWVPPGAPCEAGVCPVGTMCRPPAGGGTPVCEPMTVVLEEGKACNESVETQGPLLWCSPFSRLACVASRCGLASGSAGSPCGELFPCQEGLACNGRNVCSEPLVDGSQCARNEACASGLCLDGFCKTASCP